MKNLFDQVIVKAFPALKYHNFQLYFVGNFISLIGTWLDVVAEGWLVLQLTHSAFWVGIVTALGSLPVLFLTLFGGVIVDKFNKKHILIVTQTSSLLLAFILGILTIFHFINLWEICILAFLLGVVNAIDLPARQSFIVELITKEELSSAIALNAASFNGARVVGPAVTGFIIAAFGAGGAFLINAVSFVAVLIALFFVKVERVVHQVHPDPFVALKLGVQYAMSHPTIKMLLLFTGVTSVFGWSYGAIMPIFAVSVLHTNAKGLGFLYSAIGFGAISGALLTSVLGKRTRPINLIFAGNFLFTITLFLFSLNNHFNLALPILFFAGLGLFTQFSTISSTIQHLVEDHMRGRVLSIYTFMFLGLFPIGSFEVGFLAEHIGPKLAVASNAIVVLLFGIFIFFQEKN